mmetsp:Transcript_30252/g.70625  ORF Transcript_30252/g.70625 Transcript_30252/m.70625 type:complete len:245 (+) Transcript_30252:99-833(+)
MHDSPARIGSVCRRLATHARECSLHPLGEEIVALIVADDECGEVLDFDLPYGLHPVLLIVEHRDLGDVFLREDRRGPANGAKVEAAMLFARPCDFLRAVALGERDEGAASRHEAVNVRVHPPGGRRAERAARVPLRRLRRPRVVDDVVLGVLRQGLAALEPLEQLGVRDVARDDERAREREARANGMERELLADLRHRLVEIDAHHGSQDVLIRDLRQVGRHILAERLDEDAVARDLCFRLPVG